MQSPKKTPRTRIIKSKSQKEESVSPIVKSDSEIPVAETAPVEKKNPIPFKKKDYTPTVIPTYSPKELNDQYVQTVQKTAKEKLKAKIVKQEWKRQNKSVNANT